MTAHTPLAGAVRSDAPRTALLKQLFKRRGFESTSDLATIETALMVGDSVLGGGHADPDTVRACEEKTGRCFFVRRNPDGVVEGFIALLYLNQSGFEALMRGRFAPVDPWLGHLAARDENAAAIYVWCLAAKGDEARRALVRAVTEARRKAFEHIPLFARPVSREGRMMTAALDAPTGPAAWLGWVPQSSDVITQASMEAGREPMPAMEGEDGRIET